MVTAGLFTCVVLAVVGVTHSFPENNLTYPFGVNVAFGGKDAGTAASISWTTFNDTGSVFVQWGLQSGGPYTTTEGYTVQYYQSYQHRVVLSGLIPFTRYYYVCGSSLAVSTEFSFVTARSAGDATPYRFAVVGDLSVVSGQQTVEQMTKQASTVDWFMHVGDISYADDENSMTPGTYEKTWNQYQADMENITANYPYMVCPGNHEASCLVTGAIGCPDKLNNFSAYRHRFLMPSADSGGVENMWYSFDYGLVHFVMLSSETDYKNSPEGPNTLWNAGPFGDQMGWLKQDLQTANDNRKITPWIIVIAHRPMYTSDGVDFPPEARKNWRNAIEDMLYENNVDVYISGHVHAYERLYPIYDGVVEQTNYQNPRDVTPLVIGNGGCVEGHESLSAKTPDFIAYRNSEDWGFGVFEVIDETTLYFEMHRATNNTIFDQFTLVRSH